MASRFYLKVVDKEGNTLFNDQILANHECFDKEDMEKLGLKTDEDGYIHMEDAQKVDLALLFEVFYEYYKTKKFPALHKMTGEELLDDNFLQIPSYTVIGHYSIVFNAIFKLVYSRRLKDLTATVSFA